jgi:Na+/proline symporter
MIIWGFHFWDFVVIVVYLLTITGIGMYTAKKVKTVGDFFLGGRKFGKLLTASRDFALGTSTDEPVITVGQSYTIGLPGIWFIMMNLFSTPLYWLIRPWFRRLRFYTMGDFCQMRLGKSFGYFYSFFGLLLTAVSMGLILKGTSSAVAGITGGIVPLWAIVVVMATLFVLYGVAGGQFAAVFTNIFQAFFIVVLSVMLIPFCVIKAGGFTAITRTINNPNFFNLFESSATGVNGLFILMVALVSAPATMGDPNMATVIGKTEWETRMGMTNGMLVKRFCTIAWAFSGLFFLAVHPGIKVADQVFGTAIATLLPVGLVGLMAGALMATAMSCCEGYMVIAAAYFLESFYKEMFKNKPEKHYLFVSRVASVVCAALSIIFALAFPTLVDLIMYAWVVPSFVGIVIWVALAWRRVNRYAAWATTIVCFVVQLCCNLYFSHHGYSKTQTFIWTGAIYLPLGLITLIVVSLMTPREPQDNLDEFYALLHTPIGQEDRLKYAEVPILHY